MLEPLSTLLLSALSYLPLSRLRNLPRRHAPPGANSAGCAVHCVVCTCSCCLALSRCARQLPAAPTRPPTDRGASACTGQSVPQFDLASALTKKEKRVINKAEYMIPYHMARCPNYGWKESVEYERACELKEKISGIEAKAKKRWEASFI